MDLHLSTLRIFHLAGAGGMTPVGRSSTNVASLRSLPGALGTKRNRFFSE
jgi:hypothetical protein